MKSAVFFERDGVLNLVEKRGQQQVAPVTIDQFRIHPDAKTQLPRLREAGFLVLVTTNQPGVSSGDLSRRELDRMHDLLRRTLPINDIFLCPHGDHDHCPCRKPRTGLLTEAAFKYHLSLEHCYVVSDKWQDAKAAENVGATSLLVESQWNGNGHHDFRLPTLEAVTSKILSVRPQLASAVG